MAIVQERVPKQELMEFEPYESRVYQLPDEYAIDCLQATKSNIKRKDGREFKLTRTGEPLTVRITRLK